MPAPVPRLTLADFVEDEMLRAPLVFDSVLDAVLERWKLSRPQPSAPTRHTAKLAAPAATPQGHERLVHHHRQEVVSAALRALRGAIATEGLTPSTVQSSIRHELALIGDDDVAADIEIARCIEAIGLQAEGELRELQTYTAALVGDINVSRDTNPLRPERMVRAFWAGVQHLPLERRAQVGLLHDAAEPLAAALRLGYAGACQRLARQGVEPAAYRTIVYSTSAWGNRLPTRSERDAGQQGLDELDAWAEQEALPPLPMMPAPVGAQAHPQTLASLARERNSIEQSFERLYDGMVHDAGLIDEARPLVQALRDVARSAVLREPRLLRQAGHAMWQLIDQVAHQLQAASLVERQRMALLSRHLIDVLAGEGAVGEERLTWAMDRLAATQKHALEQAVAAAQPLIQRLERQAWQKRDEAMSASAPMPLDTGSLDTVPAELLPGDLEPTPISAGSGASLPTDGARVGTHWRACLASEWRTLQFLWRDEFDTVWLFREPLHGDRHWAVRASAVEQLAGERLIQPLARRSLVRRAAARLRR